MVEFLDDIDNRRLFETIHKEMAGAECVFGLLPHAEDNVSGCLVVMDDNSPSDRGPLVYLSVEGRLDAAVQAVRDHGGTVLQDKHPIGPYGFRAIVLDCEGNRVALHSKTE